MTSKLKTEAQRYELIGRNGQRHEFKGVLLGRSTSQTTGHTEHESRHAAPGEKCSACRWFEVYIYERHKVRGTYESGADLEYDYVVHTVGGSSVPGEKRFSRIQYTTSPYDVIELLTVRPVDREPFIAAQSARALAQAADLDEGVRDAYINRAVV